MRERNLIRQKNQTAIALQKLGPRSTTVKSVLDKQIGDLEETPLARAFHERIDVLFVPYGNEQKFSKGN